MNFYELKEFIEIAAPDLDEDTVYQLLYAFEDNQERVVKMIQGGDFVEHPNPRLGADGTSEA